MYIDSLSDYRDNSEALYRVKLFVSMQLRALTSDILLCIQRRSHRSSKGRAVVSVQYGKVILTYIRLLKKKVDIFAIVFQEWNLRKQLYVVISVVKKPRGSWIRICVDSWFQDEENKHLNWKPVQGKRYYKTFGKNNIWLTVGWSSETLDPWIRRGKVQSFHIVINLLLIRRLKVN